MTAQGEKKANEDEAIPSSTPSNIERHRHGEQNPVAQFEDKEGGSPAANPVRNTPNKTSTRNLCSY